MTQAKDQSPAGPTGPSRSHPPGRRSPRGERTRPSEGRARVRAGGGDPSSSDRWWILGFALAAFLLRVGHVLASRANPLFDYLLADSRVYDAWGRRIAAGDWLGIGVFYQDPLYPYFLGVFYTLFGRDLTGVLVVQSALGALNVPILYALGRRLWNRRAGLAAAALAALYAPFIFYDGLILKTFLEVLLFNAGLLALVFAADAVAGVGMTGRGRHDSGTPRGLLWGLIAGVLFGIGALARANFLVLVPLFVAWMLWTAPAGAPRRRTVLAGGAIAVGMLAVLLPVAIRNRVAGGEWVLTTSQGGQNLYLGVHPGNTTGSYEVPSFVRPDPQWEQEDFKREAERRAGRALSPTETSEFWLDESLAEIRRDPGRILALTARKVGLLLHRHEIPDNEDFQFSGRYSPWLRFNPIRFGLVLPLALAGAVLGWRLRRRLGWVYLAAGGYLASVALFFVFGRYRLPALGPLLILAGGCLAAVWEAARARRWRPLVPATAGLVVGLVLAHRPSSEETGPMTAPMYANLGMAHMEKGRSEEALAAVREAMRLAPSWTLGRFNLAVVLYRTGHAEEAIAEFRRVTSEEPGYAEAWSWLGNLLDQRDRPEEALEAHARAAAIQPGSALHVYNRARIAGRLGRNAEAESAAVRLLEMGDPQYSPEAKLFLSGIRAQQGSPREAARFLREYIALRPDAPMRPALESTLQRLMAEADSTE